MEIISFPADHIKQVVPIEEYRPTSEELKLHFWAANNKAFCPETKKTIANFILRKKGAKLGPLTIAEMNSLKIKARDLGVPLDR